MAENERLSVAEINIDEITDIGAMIPDGSYVGMLTAVNPKDATADKAGTVEAVWDILEGEQEGLEIRIWYSLSVTRSAKNGRVYAPGISEMKAAFAAAGQPLAPGTSFPTDPIKAAKLYASKLNKSKCPRVKIGLFGDSYKDKESGETKKVQRKKILGVVGTDGTTAGAVAATGEGEGTNIVDHLNLA